MCRASPAPAADYGYKTYGFSPKCDHSGADATPCGLHAARGSGGDLECRSGATFSVRRPPRRATVVAFTAPGPALILGCLAVTRSPSPHGQRMATLTPIRYSNKTNSTFFDVGLLITLNYEVVERKRLFVPPGTTLARLERGSGKRPPHHTSTRSRAATGSAARSGRWNGDCMVLWTRSCARRFNRGR